MTELYVCNVNESDHDIDIDALAQRLSAYRRKRISSCRVAHDRLLSAAAGYLLALALSRHGFVESALHYAVGEHGKPYFTDCPLHFNVSHSGKFAVCALSDERVGVDVQEFVPCRMHLAHRMFSREKFNELAMSREPDDLFTLFWAEAEARGKYDGRGLAGMKSTEGHLWSAVFDRHAFALCGPEFDGELIHVPL